MVEVRLIIDAKPDDPAHHTSLINGFDGAMVIETLEREGWVHHIVRPLI